MNDIIEAEPRTLQAIDSSPSNLLAIAVQRGDDMERLKQLMELQERWEANEARKAYNTAFSSFKAEAVTLVKNQRVHDGPLKGKGYAELHAVVNAITPALSRHGLSASWKLTKDERDWIEITCTLKHVAGHFEAVSMGGPPDSGGAKNAIQARASTVSYLERYTLKAIVGLAEQGDDKDGGAPHEREEVPAADEALVTAGRNASMNGMKALTAWWGKLAEAQRRTLTAEFKAMREAAQQADRRAA